MNRIQMLRKQRGITLKQLGHILAKAESTVSQYENGKREPDNETLVKMAEYFDVTTDYLLGRDEPPTSHPILSDGSNRIARFLNEVTRDPEDSIREKYLLALADLRPEEWTAIDALLHRIVS